MSKQDDERLARYPKRNSGSEDDYRLDDRGKSSLVVRQPLRRKSLRPNFTEDSPYFIKQKKKTSEESSTSSRSRSTSSDKLSSSSETVFGSVNTVFEVSPEVTPPKVEKVDPSESLKFETPNAKFREPDSDVFDDFEEVLDPDSTIMANNNAPTTTTTTTVTTSQTHTTAGTGLPPQQFAPHNFASGSGLQLHSAVLPPTQGIPQNLPAGQPVLQMDAFAQITQMMVAMMAQQEQARQEEMRLRRHEAELQRQQREDETQRRREELEAQQLAREAELERQQTLRETEQARYNAELELRERELDLRRTEFGIQERLRREEMDRMEALRKEELEVQRGFMKSNKTAQIPPMKESDSIDTFLSTYELTASSMLWDKSLWVPRLLPLLTPKAQEATHVLSSDDIKDYEKVKKVILEKFQVNEEFFRQKFRSHRKKFDDSFKELASVLTKFRNKWLKIPADFKNCTDLSEMKNMLTNVLETITVEQFYNCITNEFLKMYVIQQNPDTIEAAAKAADEYVLSRKMLGKEDMNKKSKFNKTYSNSPSTSQLNPSEAEKKSPTQTGNEGARRSLAADQCRNCREFGHHGRECPKKSEGKRAFSDPKFAQKNTKGRPGFSGLARSPEKYSQSHKEARKVWGRLNGSEVSIMLDSGSDVTLVRADLIHPNEVLNEGKCRFDCVFGDTHKTPTTQARIELRRQNGSIVAHELEVGVVKQLPVDVLLGYNYPEFANLVKFGTACMTPQSSSMVATRSLAKSNLVDSASVERATALSKRDDHGSTVGTTEDSREPDLPLFDDSIFTPSCDAVARKES